MPRFPQSSFPKAPVLLTKLGEQSLRGQTVRSALLNEEVTDPLRIEATPCENPPRVSYSLRFRLMNALGSKPSNWYEIRERLACDETRALRTLELAWLERLIVRIGGESMAQPPTFDLSPQGAALFAEGRLSVVEQGGTNWEEDRHAGPAPEPWECHYCPLCGGPAMVVESERRGTLKLGCKRSPRWTRSTVTCPAHWYGILHDGRLDVEIVGRGDVHIELDRRDNTTSVYVGQKLRAKNHGIIPSERLVSKLNTYLLLS